MTPPLRVDQFVQREKQLVAFDDDVLTRNVLEDECVALAEDQRVRRECELEVLREEKHEELVGAAREGDHELAVVDAKIPNQEFVLELGQLHDGVGEEHGVEIGRAHV